MPGPVGDEEVAAGLGTQQRSDSPLSETSSDSRVPAMNGSNGQDGGENGDHGSPLLADNNSSSTGNKDSLQSKLIIGNMDGFEVMTRNGSSLDDQDKEAENEDRPENGSMDSSLAAESSSNLSAATAEESMEVDDSVADVDTGENDSSVLSPSKEASEDQSTNDTEPSLTSDTMDTSQSEDTVKPIQKEKGESDSSDRPDSTGPDKLDSASSDKLDSASTTKSSTPSPATVAESLENSRSSADLDENKTTNTDEQESVTVAVVPDSPRDSGEKENAKQNIPNKVESVDNESDEKKPKADSGAVTSESIDISEPKPVSEVRSSPRKKPSKVDRVLPSERKGSSDNTGGEGMRPFARLLFDLGTDLVREQVYKDLVKVQTKKSANNLLNKMEEEQLGKLTEAYDVLTQRNKPFSKKKLKCKKCSYHSDTLNAMELHKEYEHNGCCAICGFKSDNTYSYYFHMEAEHNKQGRVKPKLGIHCCSFCSYEHNTSKKNFQKHMAKCAASFKLEKNLQPMPADCDIPLKWPGGAPPVPKSQPRKPVPTPPKRPEFRQAQTFNQRPVLLQAPTAIRPVRPQPMQLPPNIIQQSASGWLQDQQSPQLVQVANQYYLIVQQNGQTFMTPMTGAGPTAAPPPKPPVSNVVTKAAQPAATSSAGKFEICEVCGGFLKDRESLRIHFFWAHKIEVHPSVMSQKPGMKCPLCSKRFFTYQGYKRHTTISHPKIMDTLQQMSCYVCTNPVTDFITHMTSRHPQVVKHMLSNVRCVVCQDAFPSETALEAHMLVDHRNIVTKYGSLAGANPPTGCNNQTQGGAGSSPVPTGFYPNTSGSPGALSSGKFTSCSRCTFKYSSPSVYREHFKTHHAQDIEPCVICGKPVNIGKPLILHMQDKHLQKLEVPLKRLRPEVLLRYTGSSQPGVTAVPSHKRKAPEEVIVIDLDSTPAKKSKTMADNGVAIVNIDSDDESLAIENSIKHSDNDKSERSAEPKNTDNSKENCDMEDKSEPADSSKDESVNSSKDESANSSKDESAVSVDMEVMEVDGEKVVIQKVPDA